MSIGDEQIISTRIAAEIEKSNVLLSDVTIDGITCRFESSEFLPDFSVVIPKNFEELTPENLLLKYPNVNRPENILSNPGSTQGLGRVS